MRTLFALVVLLGTGVAQAQPARPQAAPADPHARLYAFIGTGVTAALAAGTVFVYVRRTQIAEVNNLDTGPVDPTTQEERAREALARKNRLATYKTWTIALGTATVVAGAVTAYLWTRTESTYTPPNVTFRVDPHGGAEVGWFTRF
jgi:hypothetical protein